MKKRMEPSDVDQVIAELRALPDVIPTESVETLRRRLLIVESDSLVEAQARAVEASRLLTIREREHIAHIARGGGDSDAQAALQVARGHVSESSATLQMTEDAIAVLRVAIDTASQEAAAEADLSSRFVAALEATAGPIFAGLDALQRHNDDLDRLIEFATTRRVLRARGALSLGSLCPRDLRRQLSIDGHAHFERCAVELDRQMGTSIVETYMPVFAARRRMAAITDKLAKV